MPCECHVGSRSHATSSPCGLHVNDNVIEYVHLFEVGLRLCFRSTRPWTILVFLFHAFYQWVLSQVAHKVPSNVLFPIMS
jgi:hypothetical protein